MNASNDYDRKLIDLLAHALQQACSNDMEAGRLRTVALRQYDIWKSNPDLGPRLLGHGAIFRHGVYLIDAYGGNTPGCHDDIIREVLELPWLTKRTARHEYFMSDLLLKYSYGNRGTGEEFYESKPMTVCVRHLMDWLNTDFGTQFNACFLNKYDDQHQHLGWHADDFYGMRADQPIAVVSLGAEREIWVKDKRGIQCPECNRTGLDASGVTCPFCDGSLWSRGEIPKDQRFLLKSGSLFMMPPGYQDTHLHRIPKHPHQCGWRVSMTFRSLDPQ